MTEYWEERYKNGGNSGEGSRGQHREWKWQILESTIVDIDNVIDVGCGDLAFMEGKNIKNYTGIDISKTIIKDNELKYPYWKFICSSADNYINELNGYVVFCHDILFHIIDDDVYYSILDNLTRYSNKYISIYTWHKNPIAWYNIKSHLYGSSKYQKYRLLDNDFHIFNENGFELINMSKSPVNKYGAMYIFKKK